MSSTVYKYKIDHGLVSPFVVYFRLYDWQDWKVVYTCSEFKLAEQFVKEQMEMGLPRYY